MFEIEGVNVGIFIGWTGQPRGIEIFMPGIHPCYNCLDGNGEIILPKDPETGLYRDPTTQPGFNRKSVETILVGQPAFFALEGDDPTAYRNAVKSEQFARLDFYRPIQEWIIEGKSGRWIHDEVKGKGGLVDQNRLAEFSPATPANCG